VPANSGTVKSGSRTNVGLARGGEPAKKGSIVVRKKPCRRAKELLPTRSEKSPGARRGIGEEAGLACQKKKRGVFQR